MTQLDVRPLSRAVGAEILGINLLDPVSDAQIAEIRQIWLQHGVVFFREQPLESGAFQAFAQRFGEIIEYPFVKGLPDFPLIVPVLKLPHEKHNFGGVWHTDTTYLQEPPMATMLIARELPPVGGDTLFASNYAAFEGLSPALQNTLRTLKAVNSSAKAAVTHSREDHNNISANIRHCPF
jgi:taurine dioxygenase